MYCLIKDNGELAISCMKAAIIEGWLQYLLFKAAIATRLKVEIIESQHYIIFRIKGSKRGKYLQRVGRPGS